MSETIETTATSSGEEKAHRKAATRGILLLIVAAVFWGTVGVSSGLLNRIEKTPSLTIGFLRLAFSSPFLLALAYFTTGRNPFKCRLKDLPLFAAMGLAMAGYQLFYFAAIPMASVTLVVVVALCSAPVIVALLSIPLFKERLTLPVLFSLTLALIGTIMLALGGSGDSGSGDNKNYLLGTLLALGAGFSYSSFTILTKLATRHSQAGNTQTVALAFTMGALMLLPIAFFTGNLRLDLALGVWLISAYMGLVPTGLAYIVFMNALRYATATAASIVTLLEPAVAAVLAWLLLGESISLLTISGAGLLLFSVWLLSRKG